jgi:lipopolysaccharide transport system ATP-binding protein
MQREEIRRKFDEIVAFAEIEKFLDTPVKRYSSGMYVRLAFAVAAHLEPEILIVDEVLAVGDAQFQKKCLGKMEEVGREGRTVLFVSHNMGAIRSFCNRGLLIHDGCLIEDGSIHAVASKYNDQVPKLGLGWYIVDLQRLKKTCSPDISKISIEKIEMVAISKKSEKNLATGDSLGILISYITQEAIESPAFGISILDENSYEILRLSTLPMSGLAIDKINGFGKIQLILENIPFTGGIYFLSIFVAKPNIEYILRLDAIAYFKVESEDVYNSGFFVESWAGRVVIPHQWTLLNK